MITEAGYFPHEIPEESSEQLFGQERISPRFGDKAAILEIMDTAREDEIKPYGQLQDVFPETTPPHANRVELVELRRDNPKTEEDVEHTHTTERYIIEHGGKRIFCIFKPFDGENHSRKMEHGHDKFYPQEAAAYAVSEAFGFDLVPPTIIRTINDREGSLQLFMNHNRYARWQVCEKILGITNEQTEILTTSQDYMNMALLDFILVNSDRHENNWLIRVADKSVENQSSIPYLDKMIDFNETQPPTLVAIDHGESLLAHAYTTKTLKGPSLGLTGITPKDGATGEEIDNPLPHEIPIPVHQLALIEHGLKNQDQLSANLAALNIRPEEIIYLWQRVHSLHYEKIFLSSNNRAHLTLPTQTYKDILVRHLLTMKSSKSVIFQKMIRPTEETVQQISQLRESTINLIISTDRDKLAENPFIRKLDRSIINAIKGLVHPLLSPK